jgi:hypothetical protein
MIGRTIGEAPTASWAVWNAAASRNARADPASGVGAAAASGVMRGPARRLIQRGMGSASGAPPEPYLSCPASARLKRLIIPRIG